LHGQIGYRSATGFLRGVGIVPERPLLQLRNLHGRVISRPAELCSGERQKVSEVSLRRRMSEELSVPVGQANRGGGMFFSFLTRKRVLMPGELACGDGLECTEN
jgi:hypothetical protein